MIPIKDLKAIIQNNEDCRDFSAVCQKRVGLLEAHREQANKVIDDQELRNVKLQDEVRSNKRKNKVLYPILGAALGFFTGLMYVNK